MKGKKIAVALLAVCICFALSACSFFIPTDSDSQQQSDSSSAAVEVPLPSGSDEWVPQTAQELSQKYAFTVSDPDGLLTPEACAIVDETFQIFSRPVVYGFLKGLEEQGRKFVLEFRDEESENFGLTQYMSDQIKITIYSPRGSEYSALDNGITVETIAHEFGHALHDLIEWEYGMDRMEREWTSLNGPYSYGDSWDAQSSHYFMYNYGMDSYYEDVASVFEDLAAYPQTTAARISQQENLPLLQKVEYLFKLMDRCFDLSESSLFDAYLNVHAQAAA